MIERPDCNFGFKLNKITGTASLHIQYNWSLLFVHFEIRACF